MDSLNVKEHPGCTLTLHFYVVVVVFFVCIMHNNMTFIFVQIRVNSPVRSG